MSDWEKVRVDFTDADGNEVSAVMYYCPKHDSSAAYSAPQPSDSQGGSFFIVWLDEEAVGVTPIRELPTGVGAVVRVELGYPANREMVLVRVGPQQWRDTRGQSWYEPYVSWQKYEVLSEGVQL